MKKLATLILISFAIVTIAGCSKPAAEPLEATPSEAAQAATDAQSEAAQATTDAQSEAAQKLVTPLPVTIDMNQLDQCTVAVSLEEGDAYVDDTGAMQMDVTVYTYDMYDMVDMAELKEGDAIMIQGQQVTVDSLEQNDYGTLFINGGLENNGYEFFHNESGVWFESGFDDAKSYYELGEATIRVSPDFEFYDNSDLEVGEVVYYPGDFLTEDAGIIYHFIPHNTTIVIEDGMIVQMNRNYIP